MAMELGRGFGKASACMAEEGERFHGLPPLKRFKILEKERQSVTEKRDKDVGPPPPPPEVHVRCLPAKKRVCALEDFTLCMSMSMADEEKENEVKLAKKKREQSCPAPHILQQVSNRQVSIGTEPAEECIKREDDAHNDGDGIGGDDDGIFCDVCKGGDAEPSDPIVFCDGCNVMVHVSCYGYPLIDGIPSGDWFCRQCESESESRRRKGDKKSHADQKSSSCSRTCCLCPYRSGAMKRTTGGAWAHLSCALFVPEVFYRRARDREGIECGHVPAWRWQLPCIVCSSLGEGACIQCTEVGCSSTFHVSCALDSGLTIDYRNANALTKTPAIVIAFCPSHSRQALSRSERRRFKIVPRV